MKIKILALISFFIYTLNGQSQDIRFGITANPSLVWVSPDNQFIEGDGARFGFNFGLVVDYVFGQQDRYAINTGLNLLVSGAKLKGVDSSNASLTSELTARINYLEIPLSIKLRSNQIGYLTYYGQLGFTPQFAIRQRADYTLFEDDVITEEVDNIKFDDIPVYPITIDKVRPFNIGLLVEAGVEYDISENTALMGGIFFNAGFLDMFKDSDSERVVSRNMGLRIGVLF